MIPLLLRKEFALGARKARNLRQRSQEGESRDISYDPLRKPDLKERANKLGCDSKKHGPEAPSTQRALPPLSVVRKNAVRNLDN